MKKNLQRPLTKQEGTRFDRALEKLAATLSAKGLYVTDLRRAVLQAALEHPGHFDAEALMTVVRRGYGRASRAAVYRNIADLIEAQIVHPTMRSVRKSQFYEVVFERSRQGRLICQSCGHVREFSVNAFDALRRDIAASHDFELVADATAVDEVTGICPSCVRMKQGAARAQRGPSGGTASARVRKLWADA